MKNNLKFAVAIAVSAVILGFASQSYAQKVGGYKTIEATDEGARAAAEWAVRHQAEKDETSIELMSLVKAERQVVAGMNYRLCMQVNMESEDEPVSFVQAVVYMDLKKNYKLTSWAANSTCGDK